MRKIDGNCTVIGCGKKHYSKGFCKSHYNKNYYHGTPTPKPVNKITKSGDLCIVNRCNKTVYVYSCGLCITHYARQIQFGRLYNIRRSSGEGTVSHGYKVLSINGKRVYEHNYIAEKALGKPLPKGAVVHHIDGNKLNNDPTNLVICSDQAYHMLLHKRTEDYLLREIKKELSE